jgi:uncharacterized protein YbaA (DUF1428 family)
MYVDGFILPVPKSKTAAYRKIATMAGKIWMKHGAVAYYECIGDDINPKHDPNVPIVPFPKMAKTKPGETVWFSFIIYKSKAHRDAVNKKVMADPKMQKMPGPMPFDMKRVAYGGFKAVVKY